MIENVFDYSAGIGTGVVLVLLAFLALHDCKDQCIKPNAPIIINRTTNNLAPDAKLVTLCVDETPISVMYYDDFIIGKCDNGSK